MTLHLSFATLRYYPFGGLEKSFLNICKEALSRGHVLDIYCMSWEGEYLPGANIHVLPVSARSNHGKVSEFHAKVMSARRGRHDDVFVGFKRMPDLDVYYGGDVCFANEAKVKHGSWYRLTPRYRKLIEYERAIFRQGSDTHILYISEREKSKYQEVYGTPDERFHSLPAGIAKQPIRSARESGARERIRGSLEIPEQDTVLIMVGSDFRRKGVDRAMAAMASLPADFSQHTRLLVVGEGDIAAYEARAVKMGIGRRVMFLGGRADVPDLLAASDVLLHPALVETAGNAILEGMVAGLPVIVSASAGFSYHVERAQAGILLPDAPYHQASFDRALRDILSDETARRRMSANGLSYSDVEDLYRRPFVAMNIIERVAQERRNAALAGK